MPEIAVENSEQGNFSPYLRWIPSGAIWLILFISTAVRLPYAIRYFVHYDGYWNIFIARQDIWENFIWDVQNSLHPILLFYLIKAELWFGQSLFIYRLISFPFSIASIWLIARVASKLSIRWFVGPLAALIFALSYASIDVSLEVRGYALSTFLVLIALYFYIDLINPEYAGNLNRPRVGFSIASTLAISFNYSAFFFVSACLFVPILLIIINQSQRDRFWVMWKKRWLGYVIAFLPIVIVMFVLPRIQPFLEGSIAYMQPFLYDKGGEESVFAFLWRNLQTEFIYLSDWTAPALEAYRQFRIVIPLLILIAMYFCWFRPERNKIYPGISLAFFLTMLAGIIMASLIARYPFGGYVRHQYILFPFLVLSAVCTLDQIVARIRRTWAREGLVAIVIVAFTLNSIREIRNYPIVEEKLLTTEVKTFQRIHPSPKNIYVDQFNLIAFFIHYDDWQWRYIERYQNDFLIDRYEVKKGDQLLNVCRDKLRFHMDFREASLYHSIGQCLSKGGLSSTWVFCIIKVPKQWTSEEESQFKKQIDNLAREAGLNIRSLELGESNIYAEFVLKTKS